VIWLIPAAVAAFSFFKLGSMYVWVQVLSLVIKALVSVCMLLLTSGGALALWRIRRRRPM
jgi:hypothetical protein